MYSNRSEYLIRCLDAIIEQDAFDDRVEVVISDNCSTDETQLVALKYSKQYDNIHYYRNDYNRKDENFSLALQRATGHLRKLTNDTILYLPGAIKFILDAIESNIADRPQLFFLNSGEQGCSEELVTDLNSYVKTLSFRLTWIGSFAVWEEDLGAIDVLTQNAHTRLGQVPFLINNFETKKKAIIYSKKIMESIPPMKKDLSYGLHKVFYENFLGYIRELVGSQKITSDCYDHVKKDILFNFFYGWILEWDSRNEEYIFSEENLIGLIDKEYWKETYFLKYKANYYMYKIKRIVKKLLGRTY